jgi:hypothetical protein
MLSKKDAISHENEVRLAGEFIMDRTKDLHNY